MAALAACCNLPLGGTCRPQGGTSARCALPPSEEVPEGERERCWDPSRDEEDEEPDDDEDGEEEPEEELLDGLWGRGWGRGCGRPRGRPGAAAEGAVASGPWEGKGTPGPERGRGGTETGAAPAPSPGCCGPGAGGSTTWDQGRPGPRIAGRGTPSPPTAAKGIAEGGARVAGATCAAGEGDGLPELSDGGEGAGRAEAPPWAGVGVVDAGVVCTGRRSVMERRGPEEGGGLSAALRPLGCDRPARPAGPAGPPAPCSNAVLAGVLPVRGPADGGVMRSFLGAGDKDTDRAAALPLPLGGVRIGTGGGPASVGSDLGRPGGDPPCGAAVLAGCGAKDGDADAARCRAGGVRSGRGGVAALYGRLTPPDARGVRCGPAAAATGRRTGPAADTLFLMRVRSASSLGSGAGRDAGPEGGVAAELRWRLGGGWAASSSRSSANSRQRWLDSRARRSTSTPHWLASSTLSATRDSASVSTAAFPALRYAPDTSSDSACSVVMLRPSTHCSTHAARSPRAAASTAAAEGVGGATGAGPGGVVEAVPADGGVAEAGGVPAGPVDGPAVVPVERGGEMRFGTTAGVSNGRTRRARELGLGGSRDLMACTQLTGASLDARGGGVADGFCANDGGRGGFSSRLRFSPPGPGFDSGGVVCRITVLDTIAPPFSLAGLSSKIAVLPFCFLRASFPVARTLFLMSSSSFLCKFSL